MNNKFPMSPRGLFDEERKGEFLFHYTSLSSAIAILSTQSLLFSSLSKMNDMNESWRPIISRCLEDGVIDACEEAVLSYVQISLTCDNNPEVAEPRRGFDIAPLWGHYGEGGNGVCFVLNRERLEKVVKNTPKCMSGYVHYRKDYDSAVLFETNNPEEELEKRLDEVFFYKSDQWSQEQEYRIIKKQSGVVDCVDISDCIEAVVFARLGASNDKSPCNTIGCWSLRKVCPNIPLFAYIPRNLNGSRSIVRESDGKEVWSSMEIIDLKSGEWKIGWG